MKFACNICRRLISNLSKALYRPRNMHTKLPTGCRMLCKDTRPLYILGIETSCDDTGAAIVSEFGDILGEGYYSQVKNSVKFGGVLPSIARKYHEENIKLAIKDAFKESNLSVKDLTAVAATVMPGNLRTLVVGSEYGKEIALRNNLPFIPIHHMEAHALTVRMKNEVEFPFVVLLVSGGHCLLAIAHSVDKWSIIGECADNSPGCVLDQVSRRLKLRNISGMESVSGGRAIEILAEKGDPLRFSFPPVMNKYRDSNFSFSGLESFAKALIMKLEEENGIEGGRVINEASDLCAGIQHAIVKHLVRKTHRGLKFAEMTNMIHEQNKTLVISGGVASNQFLRRAFEKLCEQEGYRLLIPPPKLCTDNGIMIAWNGVERWKMGKGVLFDQSEIRDVPIQHKSPLGTNLSATHRKLHLPNPTWTDIL